MSESYDEIANLMAEYSHRLDAGDFDGVGEVLRDAELISEGANFRATGGLAIADLYRNIVQCDESGSPCTRHILSNIRIDVDEPADRATAVSYFSVVQRIEPDFPMQIIVCGTYFDDFRRQNGVWAFVRRRMARGLTGDMSRHLRFDVIAELMARAGD